MRIVALDSRVVCWRMDGSGAARGARERSAVIVEVRSEGGAIGLGEAAPLPGMSSDDLDAAQRSIAAFAARLPFELVVGGAVDVESPSARFAIETAIASALACERGTTLARLLATSHPRDELAFAVVVDDAGDARRAAERGVRCLKIKVGPGGDLDRVHAIARAAPGARLRVDANQSWPRDAVRERLIELAGLPVDFVEEPCLDTAGLIADLERDRPARLCRLALDESLGYSSEAALARALRSPLLAAVVLKPTLLGGLGAVLRLAERARAAGVTPIVTHTLEGPIGTAACAELALAVGGEAAVGLAPHAALAGWRVAVPQLGELGVRAAAGSTPLGLGGLTLAAASAAVSAAPELSIRRAAARGPAAIAIETATARLTFADQAAAASLVSSATRRRGAPARARVVIAAPELATVTAIQAALDGEWPIGLVHHALPPAEQARQRELIANAQLPDDTALVLFTSGSTGAARGVVLSRAAVLAAVDAGAAHLGWRAGDRWLCALSLAHAGGLAVVVRCLAARAPVVLHEGAFDRAAVAGLLERCTLASLVPAQLAALLDDPAWRPPPTLRAVLLGGAAATPALLERAAERGVPFLTTYGMTETLGQVATAAPARAGDPTAPLVPLPGVTLIGGTAAEPAPLRVRGPMLATCYLDGAPIAPELVTADLGFIDATTPHIVGRADDVIISGGSKVHPSVIEAVVAATPGVRAACAFAVPDPRWGAIAGVAIAIDRGAFDLARASAAWAAALPVHARPRRLAIVDDLPTLATGKPDRRAAAQLPLAPLAYRERP